MARETIEINSSFGKIETFRHDRINKHIRRGGNHQRTDFAFAVAAVDADAAVFDIGCHIGSFSFVALSKLGPNGKLLAVEAGAETFDIAQRNLTRMAGAKCTVVNAVVSGSIHDRVVLEKDEADSMESRLMVAEAPDHALSTAVETIDSLAEKHFEPTFIKIDIEGAEYLALERSRVIEEKRPAIFVEVNRTALKRLGSSPAQLNDLLAARGYTFFVNTSPRNAGNDFWRSVHLTRLDRNPGVRLYDVLCLPADSDKAEALRSISESVE